VVARHCGFAEAAHAAFFIAFDKLDRLGAEGVLGELREGGQETKAVRSFEALLPVLQKAEVSIEVLRAALPGAGATVALQSLATAPRRPRGGWRCWSTTAVTSPRRCAPPRP